MKIFILGQNVPALLKIGHTILFSFFYINFAEDVRVVLLLLASVPPKVQLTRKTGTGKRAATGKSLTVGKRCTRSSKSSASRAPSGSASTSDITCSASSSQCAGSTPHSSVESPTYCSRDQLLNPALIQTELVRIMFNILFRTSF